MEEKKKDYKDENLVRCRLLSVDLPITICVFDTNPKHKMSVKHFKLLNLYDEIFIHKQCLECSLDIPLKHKIENDHHRGNNRNIM